jgi:glycosyltransferase involved in cell wall biosynthesis
MFSQVLPCLRGALERPAAAALHIAALATRGASISVSLRPSGPTEAGASDPHRSVSVRPPRPTVSATGTGASVGSVSGTGGPRVVHVTTVDLSLRYLLLNQLKRIAREGFTVSGMSADGPDVPALTEAGIPHIAVPLTRRLTPLVDLWALAQLYRLMKREQYTVVHTHTPKAGLLGQIAAKAAGVPVIVNTLHGFYFHDGMGPWARRFYIAMEKVAAQCSDMILSQNSEDVRTAIDEHIARPDQIRFLGNGIDVARFDRRKLQESAQKRLRSSLGIPEASPVVGFVGRLVAEKGILELMDAAKGILKAFPHTKFLIIGPHDGEKADAVTPETAKQRGLGDAFVFTGMRSDMPELLGLMDVFVLPSHREGFPRSPMEASAMGVPCVVTNIRGCREAVTDGVNGSLVELGDVAALADATVALLADGPERARMGREGRRMAEERFDEELVFDRVLDAYRECCARKGIALPQPQAVARWEAA